MGGRRPPTNFLTHTVYSYRIEQAIRAAAVLHKDIFRRGLLKLPYVTHLIAVAWLVRDYCDQEDVIVAALLHDTLEDTDYTAAELEEDFGEKVRKLVETLTEPKDLATWKERKDAYLEQLKKGPDEALIIAAADKIHNMRCIVEQYYDDHNRFLKDFPGSLDERALGYQNLSNLLNRRLNNDIIGEFNHVYTEYKNFLAYVKKGQKD